MAHTPGPWRVEVDAKGDVGVYADDYGLICYPVEDQYQANARLIATAPEMRELLERILSSADTTGCSGNLTVVDLDLDDVIGALLARIDNPD